MKNWFFSHLLSELPRPLPSYTALENNTFFSDNSSRFGGLPSPHAGARVSPMKWNINELTSLWIGKMTSVKLVTYSENKRLCFHVKNQWWIFFRFIPPPSSTPPLYYFAKFPGWFPNFQDTSTNAPWWMVLAISLQITHLHNITLHFKVWTSHAGSIFTPCASKKPPLWKALHNFNTA